LKFEQGEIPAIDLWSKSTDNYNDETFLPILNNITKTIPINESIVTNFKWGVPEYFIPQNLEIPWDDPICTNNRCSSYSSAEKSLIEWMTLRNLTYLLIFNNVQIGEEIVELKPLFDAKGLQYLKDREDEIVNRVGKDNRTINYLSEMAHSVTENNITIDLYKLKTFG
jgi:hypothetical protein